MGLAEIKFSRNKEDILVAHGLGSCVGVALYDRHCNLGGMAHVVLPDSSIQGQVTTPERFANSAIPLMIDQFKMLGGNMLSSFIKIAGGARMFQFSSLSTLDIGSRNVEAIKEALEKINLRINASDVGGTNGRTFRLFVENGRVTSRAIGLKEVDL